MIEKRRKNGESSGYFSKLDSFFVSKDVFFFFLLFSMLSSSRKKKQKQTSVIRWGANFHFEHFFATYMLACIYVTD